MKFFALAALCTFGVAGYAGTISFTPTNIVDSQSSATETMGWGLTLSQGVTITALDYYDPAGVSLISSHQIGIWDLNSQALLASVTVPSGVPAATNGVYESLAIAPVVLGPGTYIVGASINRFEDKYIFTAGTSNVQPGVIVNGISYTGPAGPGPFGYPNQVWQSQGTFFLANFEIGSAVTSGAPEPSSWMLVAGAGLLGLILCRYKFRVG